MKKKISLLITIIFINGCSLSPGMHMETKSTWLDESKYVSIDSFEDPLLMNFHLSFLLVYLIGLSYQIYFLRQQ